MYSLENDDIEIVRSRFCSKNHQSSVATEDSTDLSDDSKSFSSDTSKEIDPWSLSYIGVTISYLCCGLMLGGSTSILYPYLIVQEGVSSSTYTASVSIVTIFWSYKLFFGILSDCFPIFGLKRKSYMCLGWFICAAVLTVLCSMGDAITSKTLVLMLALANMGYIAADVAADGFMVWIAHREPVEKRGKMQTLVYAASSFGQLVINVLILFGFSGPEANCAGFEPDETVECTLDERVASRNGMMDAFPDTWCHRKCHAATFDFGLTVSEYAWILACFNLVCMPFYLILREEKTPRKEFRKFLGLFWTQLKRRAAWQIILYTMISQITFGVTNAAKPSTNFLWLNLQTMQNQIMVIMEKVVFIIGLSLVRKFALNMSWRKLIWCGSILVTFFNFLYFFVVFDIWRNAWFYIFTDVSASFMYTLNFMASMFGTVEISEPGFEAITYALVTTASNAVAPLSAVISYQVIAFFPSLHDQNSIATDTPQVRRDFALLHAIVIGINLSSLFALPMLPRQKKETRDMVALGETSVFWGMFALLSATVFLIYSTVVTFMTVAGADTYGCFKVLGGAGCSEHESSVPAYVLVACVLLYCYGVNFYISFLPIIKGEEKRTFDIFF